jgi:hypothetical protein
MPAEEARTFLQQIQQKIASSDIEVAHRDVLIRLRSIIEEDLEAEGEPQRLPQTRISSASDHNAGTTWTSLIPARSGRSCSM